MKTQELLHKFAEGVNWNALLYFVYKCTSTLCSQALYHILSAELFSIYANLNCSIYIMILWLDFGLQKSIPRFYPEYAQDKTVLEQFIKRLIFFKTYVLIAALPLYLILAENLFGFTRLTSSAWFLYGGALLILTEGLTSIARLLYHAYFLQKTFNSLNSLTLMLEITLNLTAMLLAPPTITLLTLLVINKIISSSLLLLLAWLYRGGLYSNSQQQDMHQSSEMLDKQFLTHTGFMWFSTNIKSLTERNVLFPLFTTLYGIELANMFKIAQDWALLFYRIVIKTIGTTDTSLFAYITNMGEQNETVQVAFKNLALKISGLVIPLLGILYLCYYSMDNTTYDSYVFHLFLIITISLLLEVLFSPYERILEVKRDYLLLIYAYTPYLLLMLLLFFTNLMTLIGLLGSLICIHVVRLVSVSLMILLARMRYGLRYPFTSTLLYGLCVCTVIQLLVYSSLYISRYIPSISIPLHSLHLHPSLFFRSQSG